MHKSILTRSKNIPMHRHTSTQIVWHCILLNTYHGQLRSPIKSVTELGPVCTCFLLCNIFKLCCCHNPFCIYIVFLVGEWGESWVAYLITYAQHLWSMSHKQNVISFKEALKAFKIKCWQMTFLQEFHQYNGDDLHHHTGLTHFQIY